MQCTSQANAEPVNIKLCKSALIERFVATQRYGTVPQRPNQLALVHLNPVFPITNTSLVPRRSSNVGKRLRPQKRKIRW